MLLLQLLTSLQLFLLLLVAVVVVVVAALVVVDFIGPWKLISPEKVLMDFVRLRSIVCIC